MRQLHHDLLKLIPPSLKCTLRCQDSSTYRSEILLGVLLTGAQGGHSWYSPSVGLLLLFSCTLDLLLLIFGSNRSFGKMLSSNKKSCSNLCFVGRTLHAFTMYATRTSDSELVLITRVPLVRHPATRVLYKLRLKIIRICDP